MANAASPKCSARLHQRFAPGYRARITIASGPTTMMMRQAGSASASDWPPSHEMPGTMFSEEAGRAHAHTQCTHSSSKKRIFCWPRLFGGRILRIARLLVAAVAVRSIFSSSSSGVP
ncbi:hypothetical protein SNOG_11590 [Parastagonospora nodorum SN15]|uniref:Uncharacterized protein n=1 Tax=Phaeosphaeria nodorum (strain SN15 / ATCC MYA-4574 / FGSC 10173) TaxID=321614 RepID=Q0U9H4_PHANO|nr:hypothetical protein SNOG_11590 [Parastagonospora nodorum SN15]EAT81298.1 hypothetical protein SNOG_11590 [Parastagonospora nodorum SN15]